MHKSDFADDRDMKELVDEYVRRLPEEVARLGQLLANAEVESLRRVAHQLKGSGGGYGFDGITELAGRAEGTIKEGAGLETIRGQIDELIGYIRDVEGYEAKREIVRQ